MPFLLSADKAVLASQHLITALLHPSASSPISCITDPQRLALGQLSNIFSDITTPDVSATETITLPRVLDPTVSSTHAPLPRVPATLATRHQTTSLS